ncbi:MAG TPA: hypothetical protein PLU24_00960 [Candidatus Omnitrophota bacterium]|nr:hypothetical protein [Candidatus Omnitrophota bacterium]
MSRLSLVFLAIVSLIFISSGAVLAQEDASMGSNQEVSNSVMEGEAGNTEIMPPTMEQTEVATQPDNSLNAAMAQNETIAPVSNKEAAAETSTETPETNTNSTEWIWGEVVGVNAENREISLKHLDYDTYEEVQITIKLDDKTLLENVIELGEVKPGDHVTVDYKVQDGVNLAGLIVVEKKEAQTDDLGSAKEETSMVESTANVEVGDDQVTIPQEQPKMQEEPKAEEASGMLDPEVPQSAVENMVSGTEE